MNSKPLLLDLFCGAGGSAAGYVRAGFDVIGVDVQPQPNYPFRFVQKDVFETVGVWGRFDAIHASPPCQAYSVLGSRYDRTKHPDLIAVVRERLVESGVPWIIENVYGAPLNNPVRLCGSSFDLGVRRHRYFECSFPVMVPPCTHSLQPKKYRIYEHGKWFMSSVARVYGVGGGKAKDQWGEAMDISWMTGVELSQAVPPAFTEYLGLRLIEQLERAA